MRLRSPPLFWRTFLLILLLFAASMAAWWPTVQVFEREPRARQIAQQVVSIVNTTRSALVFSDPGRRRDLLNDLADNEGIRVVPLEPGDQLMPLPDDALVRLVTRNVRAKLGPATRLASEVNGVPGMWISFSIDDDAYWAFIDRDLLAGDVGREWIAWAALAAIISLLIAAAIAGLVNRPLAELSELIVRQFLDYARPVGARPPQAADVSALALDALSRSRVGAAIGCRVDQQVEPGLRVLGHPTELARALDNMLNNAVQYGRGPAGDLDLRLEVHRDGSEAIVAVSDSGPGIAPDQIERLLRPFERGDASRSGSGGAGLGLAIVDRIARAHHGRLQLSANSPTGLRVELRLPAIARDN